MSRRRPLPNLSADLSRRSILLSAASILGAAGVAHAVQTRQKQENQPTFSAGVNVVNVFATVRDKDGKVIRNLGKDDFALEEDGRPQTIRYFSQQSDLPLTLGLLVDTSGSERRMLGTERDASRTFLEEVLRPDKDKAFLIHFDREVELLQDLTSSRQRLEKALDLIDQPQWGGKSGNNSPDPNGSGGNGGWGGRQGGGRRGGGGYGRRGHGGTALYDAIYLGSSDLMSKQAGRKALILLTDGEDNGSKITIDDAVRSAQCADTLAYSVRIADEQPSFSRGFGGPGMGRHGGTGGGGWGGPGPMPSQNRPDGKKILRQISKETGGGYFEISKKKTVDEIYKEIEEELRNQYSIAYTSDRPANGGEFRRISLTVKPKGLIVQSRSGYYPGQSS